MAKQQQQQQPAADDSEDVRERDLVEAYLDEHSLESALNDALNDVVSTRPADPFTVLSALLYARATAQRGVFRVDVREVLDGIGAPTVLVRLHTGKGVFEASCASETSGLPDEPDELGTPLIKQRLGGRGYRKRAESAAQALNDKLLNIEPTEQLAIDAALGALESEVGRNVCHAVSVAACKAGARYAELPLAEYIAKLHDAPLESLCVPMPLFSVVNAGKYASNKLFVQEVFIAPASAVSFADAYQIGAEFTQALREQLETSGVGSTNVGAFGGFAPQLQTLAELFQILRAALDEARARLEYGAAGLAAASLSPLRIEFGVDFSASEFVLPPPPPSSSSADNLTSSAKSAQVVPATAVDDDEARGSTSYNMDKWDPGSSGMLKTSEEMLDIIRSAVKELDIALVVDPFDKDDVKTFAALLSSEHDQDASGIDLDNPSALSTGRQPGLGGDPNCRVQIAGKALFQHLGLEMLHEERACNTVVLHLHHFATVTRALEVVTEAKRLGLAVILGAVAGQNSDAAFLAAVAVGTGVGQVQFGGLAGADAVERYNQLLLLSDDAFAPEFVANTYRR
ncbi:hypothetical protein PybrP1_004349 [[Pythium] brassicae (nom. inval.)]|nr:hypothetical protein PybrP1_004349 [[Pythium] brassicae (nom. inval.)]